MKSFLFLSLALAFLFENTYAYILPQTFKEFHPIGIFKSINTKKPYTYNLGTLPMILWFDKNNNPNSMINTCKHLGNNLKDSTIKNGCLVCPFHKSSYNETDKFGSTIIKDGLIWWNYKSQLKIPPSLPLSSNEMNKDSYKTINFKTDININIISFVLNFMYLYNLNVKYLFKNKKMLITSYNNNHTLKLFYKYPYTIIVSNTFNYQFMNNDHKLVKSVFMINILPISTNKSRLYITVKYKNGFVNYLINIIHSFIIKLFIYNLKFKLEKSYNNFLFKQDLMFKHKNNNDDYLIKINDCYKNYMPLNHFTVNHFMINKNFY